VALPREQPAPQPLPASTLRWFEQGVAASPAEDSLLLPEPRSFGLLSAETGMLYTH
jgi:hypothetical protein